MLKIKQTSQFKKDLKAAIRQRRNLNRLEIVIDLLAAEKALPWEYHDHQLSGKLKRFRECHISPDWLLLYEINHGTLILTLTRLGSHSELLGR